MTNGKNSWQDGEGRTRLKKIQRKGELRILVTMKIKTEIDKGLVVCQLIVAYTSHEYYKNSEHG